MEYVYRRRVLRILWKILYFAEFRNICEPKDNVLGLLSKDACVLNYIAENKILFVL